MNNDRYLFRGKRLDNGEWVLFSYIGAYCDEKGIELEPKRLIRDCGYKVDPATVGQCTGLRDKNGTLIFEGDILTAKEALSGPVEWDDGQWFGARDYLGYAVRHGVGIIGNIHDNPELLEAENDSK